MRQSFAKLSVSILSLSLVLILTTGWAEMPFAYQIQLPMDLAQVRQRFVAPSESSVIIIETSRSLKTQVLTDQIASHVMKHYNVNLVEKMLPAPNTSHRILRNRAIEYLKSFRKKLEQQKYELSNRKLKSLFRLKKRFENHHLTFLEYSVALNQLTQGMDFSQNYPYWTWFHQALDHALPFDADRFAQNLDWKRLNQETERVYETLQTQWVGENIILKNALRCLESFELLQRILALNATSEEAQSFLNSKKLFLDHTISQALIFAHHFYQNANRKNAIFSRQLIEKMENKKLDRCVVVVGGFYTEDIASQLRKKNISYVIVSPLVANS